MPARLRPADIDGRVPITHRRCWTCNRILPIGCYSAVRQGTSVFPYRHCNQCRAKKHESQPRVVERRKLIDEARSKPCVVCGRVNPPEAVDLVHAKGERKFLPTSMYRMVSTPVLLEELEKCVPVCAVCRRLTTRTVRNGRRGRQPRVPYVDLAEIERASPTSSSRNATTVN